MGPKLSGFVEGSLCLSDKVLEGLRFAYGEIGHDFTVKFDACEVEAVDKSTVVQAMLAGRGVDARDPQRAEAAFLGPTVAVCVLEAFFNAFNRCREDRFIRPR